MRAQVLGRASAALAALRFQGHSPERRIMEARADLLRIVELCSAPEFVVELPNGGGYVEQVTPEAFCVRPDVGQASRFASRVDAMNYAAGVGLSVINVREVDGGAK